MYTCCQLRGYMNMDMTSIVDAKLILDSFQRTTIKLLWEILKACVGKVRYVGCIYMRLLHRTPSSKKSRKDPRKPSRA